MSENGFEYAPDICGTLGIAFEMGDQPKYQIDYERYRGFFDDLDVSDVQKDQMIEALFLIGQAFYDAGFGFEFVGQTCGKPHENEEDSPDGGEAVISSAGVILTEHFNLCAAE
ncbi:hypothetical protein SAMN05443573_102236 [Celeribacter indicus]|nr:hypothetical protein SAMN05443573_102236 [Celeribacter indicus]